MTFPRRGDLICSDPIRPAATRSETNTAGHYRRGRHLEIIAHANPVAVIVAASKGNGLPVPSAIQLSQIRSVDRERLVKRLGTLDAAAMRKVDRALKISLGLVDL